MLMMFCGRGCAQAALCAEIVALEEAEREEYERVPRPRGRAPKGKRWDDRHGCWVADGATVAGTAQAAGAAGALTAATCSRNSDSLFGGFISFMSPSPSARAVPRLWLASCVLAALLAP